MHSKSRESQQIRGFFILRIRHVLLDCLNLQQIGRSGNTERYTGRNDNQIAGLSISGTAGSLYGMLKECIGTALLIDYKRMYAP